MPGPVTASSLAALARRMLPLAALALVALLSASTAQAAATWRSYGIQTQAPVVGLDGTKTFFRASLLVKSTWRPESIRRGTLRFRAGTSLCPYTVTFTLKTALGPAVAPADRALADLPAPANAYVLDSGTRKPGAWRVTRERGNMPIRIHGEYVRIAHPDAGLVPAGQAAWATIVATAKSHPGAECHAGSWRSNLGPGIGDAFATTRTAAYARRAG
jgi:hypothetical protein